MPAPLYRSGYTQSFSGAEDLTFDISGAQSGDFMIVFLHESLNANTELWEDDGGDGNGWTLEVQNETTAGRNMECAIFWKFHTGTESNPTFDFDTGGNNFPMAGVMLFYSGVATGTPFNGPTYSNGTNDAAPPNPSVSVTSTQTRVVCFHAATHDDISSVGAPTGFTIRDYVYGGSAQHNQDHRDTFSADIQIDSIGTYSPPDWQHGFANTTPEYQTYSIALIPAVVGGASVTGGTSTANFYWGNSGLTVTGSGFEATQGTGKVEYWSDISGTVKTAQTVTTWGDTGLVINSVQGSLGNETTVYLVVTNDTGQVSSPFGVYVGLLGYESLLINDLKCDHLWAFQNNYTDTGFTGPQRDANVAVIGTWTFSSVPIRDGATHAANFNNVSNARETTQSPNMNITINSVERTLSFWLVLNGTQPSLGAIYKEGGAVQNIAFLTGYGNTLCFQVADLPGNAINAQAWSDFRLVPGRPYNITGRYSLSETPKIVDLHIDGVLQSNSSGNPPGTGSFDSHSGSVCFNNPDNSLETGGTDIAYSGMEDAKVSDFASWGDNSTGTNKGFIDSITGIRDILFRRGALPDDTIVSGTQASMQTALDSTANSRRNWPLSYRIEEVSGGGNFELTMNNKVFDPLITMDLEYRGTDTLTIVRPINSNFNEAKSFSPLAGTIEIIDLVPITVKIRNIEDNSAIPGARIRLLTASGGPEAAGVSVLEGVTTGSGELIGTYRYKGAPQPLTGKVRQGTLAPTYRSSSISDSITIDGLNLTVFMIKDS